MATTLQFILLMTISAASAADTATVTEISGTRNSGSLKTWDANKVAVSGAPDVEISRTSIRSIAFDYPLQKAVKVTSAIWLANGDRISAKAVGIADDLLSASWPGVPDAGTLKISLENVAAVILEMPPTRENALRLSADLETLPAGSDLVMLTNDDRSLGEFEGMDATFVRLKVGKSSLNLDRSRVRAIRFDPELVIAKPSTQRRMLLTLIDGSRLTASRVELKGAELTVTSLALGDLRLPLSIVTSCQFFGDRIIPLTDATPANIEFTPYLSTTWSLVKNANVLHGPLTIRGIEYSTGLGTHSRMKMSYDLRGDEREFQSVVGIDDAANGAGSVAFAVEVDGRRVWTSSDITGRSLATNVPAIPLSGSKRLKLIVDFGQFADVSDYADWCDPVLILERPR